MDFVAGKGPREWYAEIIIFCSRLYRQIKHNNSRHAFSSFEVHFLYFYQITKQEIYFNIIYIWYTRFLLTEIGLSLILWQTYRGACFCLPKILLSAHTPFVHIPEVHQESLMQVALPGRVSWHLLTKQNCPPSCFLVVATSGPACLCPLSTGAGTSL